MFPKKKRPGRGVMRPTRSRSSARPLIERSKGFVNSRLSAVKGKIAVSTHLRRTVD